MSCVNLTSNCVLPVPIGSSRNWNFKADVLETHSHWAFLPMIFVISIFELTKTARSDFKVLGVGSIGLLVNHLAIARFNSEIVRKNYILIFINYRFITKKLLLPLPLFQIEFYTKVFKRFFAANLVYFSSEKKKKCFGTSGRRK